MVDEGIGVRDGHIWTSAGVTVGIDLTHAQPLLQATLTALPLKGIAKRTRLGDASALWRAITQQLGATPAAYRQRFTFIS